MSYIEKSTNWILKRLVLNGLKTLSEGVNIFYSIITLILIISTSILGFLTNIIGLMPFQFILSLLFGTIISFLLSSIINIKVKSGIIRVILTSLLILSITSIIYMYYNIIGPFLIYFGLLMIFVSLILIILNGLLFFRNVYNSWYYRLMTLGKSSKHFFFEKPIKFLSILSFFIYIYPIYQFIITGNPFEIFIVIIGIIASILNLISVMKKSNYKYYDIYQNIISNVYLVSFIFLFLYYQNSVLIVIGDLIIYGIVILNLVQNIKYWGIEGGISGVKISRKQKIPDDKETEQEVIFDKTDDSIIIIEETVERNSFEKIEIPIEEDESEKINKNSYYLIILAIILGSHLLFLWYFSSIFQLNLLNLIIIQDFSLINYILSFGLYMLVIIIFIAYNKSKKFQNFLTFPPSIRNSFLEFLSLMDKKERTKLLRAISRTIQQIIVEGLIDLLESEKGNIIDTISEGIKRGAKFFRSIFGDKED
ncbi:MAG: hypothetical protein ACTSPY_07050 [Candidatus Helarchaeota archaeon]